MKNKNNYWAILIAWSLILLFSCKKTETIQPKTNTQPVIASPFIGTWSQDSSCTGPKSNTVHSFGESVRFTSDTAYFHSSAIGDNSDKYSFTSDSLVTMEDHFKYKIVSHNLSLTFKCDICSDTTRYYYHKP